MRVPAVALLVGLLVVPVGGAQPRASDLEREGLRGAVRSVRIEVITDGGARTPVSSTQYDGRGDEVATTRYADGDEVERQTLRYTPAGALVCDSLVRTAPTVFALVSTADPARRAASK